MRVVFTRFPLESAFGGAEVQTLSLMEGLLAQGHAVAFAGSCPVLLKECRARHIPCVELDIGPPPVTMWHAASFAWRQRRMKKKLEEALGAFDRIDALCMLSLSEKLLVTDWAAARKVRVLWIEHDRVGRWLEKNPWLQRLLSLSRHALTVTVSELSARIYLKLGWVRDGIRIIPNGIDLERFGKPVEAAAKQHPGNILRVGCIARLTHDKGVDVLIASVVDLPQVHVHIVGEGRDEGAIKKMIADLKLTDRVHLYDRVADLGPFYRSLDVLVLPSREHDPFGLVAAEAMALGLPVIVTHACGIADYLHTGRDALVIPADSPAALRQALLSLKDPVLRQQTGEQAHKTAVETFSLPQMTKRYIDVLSDPAFAAIRRS